MAREGEVEIDCAKVRKLLLEDCKLSRAGAEKRMDVPHSVLHRMFGGSREAPQESAVVHDRNAKEIVRLARQILRASEAELPFESIFWTGEQKIGRRDRAGAKRAAGDSAPAQTDAVRTAAAGSGDGAGAARLLVRRLGQLQPKTLTELLNPECTAVAFVGREVELAMLRDWCNGDEPLSVQCLIGDAGAGKTRLALELCARQAAADWRTGFLDEAGLSDWHRHGAAPDADGRPVLAVVDYAATKRDRLKLLLPQLAARARASLGPKYRVLLLERHADVSTGWWSDLMAHESNSHWLKQRAFQNPPLSLSVLDRIEDQQAIAQQTLTAASQILELPCPDIDLILPRVEHEARIDRTGPALPLKVMMAACLGVLRQGPVALDQRIAILARDLAEYEFGRISRTTRDRGLSDAGSLARHVSGITALDGLSSADLIDFVRAERSADGTNPNDSVFALAEVLVDLLPTRDERAEDGINGLRPDLIGEAFVLRVLNGRMGPSNLLLQKSADQTILRWYGRDAVAVASFLIRTIQDFADLADHVSLRWFDLTLESTTDGSLLSLISDAIPVRTVHLRSRAAHILEQQLATAVEDHADESMLADRARLHHNLAVRLGQLGDAERAIVEAWRAIELYQRLVDTGAKRYEPDLGTALFSLANRFLSLRRPLEGRDAAREASDILRKAVDSGDETRRSDLALSLNALALCLSATGEHNLALQSAVEAVHHLTNLAASDPSTYEPDLAVSLANLAHRLIGVGDAASAHEAALKAAPLARRLADLRPDAFEMELAAALNSLSSALVKLGYRQEALECASEIVPIYRRLALLRPDPFRSDVSVALKNLANCYGALERWSDARGPAVEAFAIRQKLETEGLSDAANLAAAHLTLGQVQGNLGEYDQAIEHTFRAVILLRGLVDDEGEAHLPDLAVALDAAATRAMEVGRVNEGRAWSGEAVEVYRQLARKRPSVFAGALAIALNNLANATHKSGLQRQALKLGRQSVAIYERLARSNPVFFNPGLARALNNFATFLSTNGHNLQAYEKAKRATAILRSLTESDPLSWTPILAGALVSLAIKASHLEEHLEALALAEEAVHFCRGLAEQNGGIVPSQFAPALVTYANCLEANHQTEAAINAAIEAIACYHGLFAKFPDSVREDFARAWWSLSDCLWSAGNRDEAKSSLEEAIVVLSPGFVAAPRQYFQQMRQIVSEYVRRCDEMGVEPHLAVLDPVVKTYESLQEEERAAVAS